MSKQITKIYTSRGLIPPGKSDHKHCINCGIIKPIGEFHKNKRIKDGFNYYCKLCKRIKNRKYYKTEKHLAANREYMRKKRLDPEQRRIDNEKRKAYYQQAKQKAKEFFGFSIFCCVYSDELKWDSNTIIHHKDGSNEHKGQALLHPQSWDRCIVLCKRCHRVLHTVSNILTHDQVDILLNLRDELCQEKLEKYIQKEV